MVRDLGQIGTNIQIGTKIFVPIVGSWIVVPRTSKGHLGTGPTFVNSRCESKRALFFLFKCKSFNCDSEIDIKNAGRYIYNSKLEVLSHCETWSETESIICKCPLWPEYKRL